MEHSPLALATVDDVAALSDAEIAANRLEHHQLRRARPLLGPHRSASVSARSSPVHTRCHQSDRSRVRYADGLAESVASTLAERFKFVVAIDHSNGRSAFGRARH